MSALIEKRNEFKQKLDLIKTQRNFEISQKVAAYKASLEKEPIQGEVELQKVIDALDQVIAFESNPQKLDLTEQIQFTDNNSQGVEINQRPGMSSFEVPRG